MKFKLFGLILLTVITVAVTGCTSGAAGSSTLTTKTLTTVTTSTASLLTTITTPTATSSIVPITAQTTTTSTKALLYTFPSVTLLYQNYPSKFLSDLPVEAQSALNHFLTSDYNKLTPAQQFDKMLNQFNIVPANSKQIVYTDNTWDFIVPGVIAKNAPKSTVTTTTTNSDLTLYLDSQCTVPFTDSAFYGGFCSRSRSSNAWVMPGQWGVCAQQGEGWEQTTLTLYVKNTGTNAYTAYVNDSADNPNSLGYVSSPIVQVNAHSTIPISILIQHKTGGLFATGAFGGVFSQTFYVRAQQTGN